MADNSTRNGERGPVEETAGAGSPASAPSPAAHWGRPEELSAIFRAVLDAAVEAQDAVNRAAQQRAKIQPPTDILGLGIQVPMLQDVNLRLSFAVVPPDLSDETRGEGSAGPAVPDWPDPQLRLLGRLATERLAQALGDLAADEDDPQRQKEVREIAENVQRRPFRPWLAAILANRLRDAGILYDLIEQPDRDKILCVEAAAQLEDILREHPDFGDLVAPRERPNAKGRFNPHFHLDLPSRLAASADKKAPERPKDELFVIVDAQALSSLPPQAVQHIDINMKMRSFDGVDVDLGPDEEGA